MGNCFFFLLQSSVKRIYQKDDCNEDGKHLNNQMGLPENNLMRLVAYRKSEGLENQALQTAENQPGLYAGESLFVARLGVDSDSPCLSTHQSCV